MIICVPDEYIQKFLNVESNETDPFCPFPTTMGYCTAAYSDKCKTCAEPVKAYTASRLRRYSQKCVTERLDPDFAEAVQIAIKLLTCTS